MVSLAVCRHLHLCGPQHQRHFTINSSLKRRRPSQRLRLHGLNSDETTSQQRCLLGRGSSESAPSYPGLHTSTRNCSQRAITIHPPRTSQSPLQDADFMLNGPWNQGKRANVVSHCTTSIRDSQSTRIAVFRLGTKWLELDRVLTAAPSLCLLGARNSRHPYQPYRRT